jgi:hypothetical protein
MQLIGFTWFASAGMLFWATAAAVPVIIHLWSRRKYRETSWAAMQFLRAAIERNQRRLRIEQWILLAVRTLILLLLAVALAEPILSGLAIGIGTSRQPSTHTVLVIDASYSMGYEQRGETRFAAARALASTTVRGAAPGAAFSLVVLADPPQAVVVEPSMNHPAVLDEIAGLELSHATADLSAALSEVERLLDDAAGRFDEQRVLFFSDLGSNTWADATSPNCRARLGRLASRVTLGLHDVGQVEVTNVSITGLTTSRRAITVNEPVDFDVELRNVGHHDLSRMRVELLVDGAPIDEKYVDIPANGQSTITFSYHFRTAGDHAVQARIDKDPLAIDNARWLTVSVREALRVLCVQGRAHAAEYVALAMQPLQEEASVIRPEVVSSHTLIESQLAEFDCLFLCNVPRFSPEEARRLHEYVARGGGLVIVLGDLVEPDNYNATLGAASELRLLPANIETVVGDELYRFDPLEYRHPLIAPFRGHERAGLITAPVWRYFRLHPQQDRATVALAFNNGDPAIVETETGRGRTVLVATAASPESVDQSTAPPTPWTALPSWPSFPPLIHEMVHFVAGSDVASRTGTVGQRISSRARFENRDTSITSPDETQAKLDVTADGVWSFYETGQAGIYRAKYDAETTELFAVNVNPAEGELTRADSTLFNEFFQDEPQDDESNGSATEPGTPLFRIVLGCVVVLLLTDTLLAWSFGRE